MDRSARGHAVAGWIIHRRHPHEDHESLLADGKRQLLPLACVSQPQTTVQSAAPITSTLELF